MAYEIVFAQLVHAGATPGAASPTDYAHVDYSLGFQVVGNPNWYVYDSPMCLTDSQGYAHDYEVDEGDLDRLRGLNIKASKLGHTTANCNGVWGITTLPPPGITTRASKVLPFKMTIYKKP